MVGRLWRGRIRARDVAEYRAYISATGLADYRRTPGNRAAYMLTRVDGDIAEIITVSIWDGLDSIRRFAGDDITKARYYPEDERFLLEFRECVEHFEVDVAAGEGSS